jgi:hypothetical protein
MNLLSDIIPSGWESSEYEYIFNEAQTKVGVHL